MTVITIPKEHKNESRLIAITPLRYKRLLGIESKPVQSVPKKRAYNADASIKRALKQIKQGKVYGPFNSAKELMASLRAKN